MAQDYTIVSPSVPYSEATQRISNKFPDWHAIRRQKESIAHGLLNATTGIPSAELKNEIDNFTRQTNIILADTTVSYKAFVIDIQDTVIRPKKYNLLRNSNFIEWTNPALPPDFWECTSQLNSDLFYSVLGTNETNYLGGYTLLVLSKNVLRESFIPIGRGYLYQTYQQPDGADIRTWQASCYYKRVGTQAINNAKVKLYLELTYDDKTTDVFTSVCTDTEEWSKLVVTALATKRVFSIKTGIMLDNVLNSDDLFTVYVNNFMLCNAIESIPWCRHKEDTIYPLEPSSSDICVITSSRDGGLSRRNLLFEVPGGITTDTLPSSVSFNNFVKPTQYTVIPDPQPIHIEDAYLYDGTRHQQAIIVSNNITARRYGWPNWTKGRIVKFDPNNPTEIYATYKPAFMDAIDRAVAYSVDSIYITCITEHRGKYWLAARFMLGNTLKYTANFTTILMAIDRILPKQPTDFDAAGIDMQNDITYVPILKSYMFDATGGRGFGASLFNEEVFGGDPSPKTVDTLELVFEENDKVLIKMELGFEARLDLMYDYFTVDETNRKLYLFRNYVLDNKNNRLIVC